VKTLYFDINGTLTFEYACKPALAGGAFEGAVRRAGFERLVCVSNIQNTIKLLADLGRQPDGLAILFDMCWGAFSDPAWFRQVTTVVSEPDHRARFIDLSRDWWYLDDLARDYLETEGLSHLFAANAGSRILAPARTSDGAEILDWLRAHH